MLGSSGMDLLTVKKQMASNLNAYLISIYFYCSIYLKIPLPLMSLKLSGCHHGEYFPEWGWVGYLNNEKTKQLLMCQASVRTWALQQCRPVYVVSNSRKGLQRKYANISGTVSLVSSCSRFPIFCFYISYCIPIQEIASQNVKISNRGNQN